MPAHNKPIGPLTMNEVLRMSIEQMAGNGSSRRSRQMEEVLRRTERMQAALSLVERIFREVMPKLQRESPRLELKDIEDMGRAHQEAESAMLDAWKEISNQPACNI